MENLICCVCEKPIVKDGQQLDNHYTISLEKELYAHSRCEEKNIPKEKNENHRTAS